MGFSFARNKQVASSELEEKEGLGDVVALKDY